MHKKISLDTVTLVTVTSVHIEDTLSALLHNLKGIDFAAVKFISHEKPKNLPTAVEHCKIQKIASLDDYSKFMLYDLSDYIDTPHCLTIHRDGVIAHPNKWQNSFLNYDYIGAPWPMDEAFRDPRGNIMRVGNGGFSLRSKALLELPGRAKIPFSQRDNCLHEDILICVEYHEIFKMHGLQFADIDVAKYFAHEMRIPEIKGIKPFGFHKYRKQNRFYPKFPSRTQKFLRKYFNIFLD